jgi:hypothetical protein
MTMMARPKVTPEMIAEAAQKLATGNGWDADQAADVAKVYRDHMDGYELAKELESRCLWGITVMDVDALDCMASEVLEIHRAACTTWAKEQDTQPPLPVGAMTTKGEITGIYEHDAACYLIRETGETRESRRLIVRFEDARPPAATGNPGRKND